MVSANTFGVNAFKCKNLEYTVDELVTAGVRLTKEAIAEVKKRIPQKLTVQCFLRWISAPSGSF